jgi:hypothetical protein
MDPLSLIGGVSAAGAIIAAVTRTVQNLYDMRGKFDGADLTIRLLIVELNTIKAALIQNKIGHNTVSPVALLKKSFLTGLKSHLRDAK